MSKIVRPQFGWAKVGSVRLPIYSQDKQGFEPYKHIKPIRAVDIDGSQLKKDLRSFVTPERHDHKLLKPDDQRMRIRTRIYKSGGKPVYEYNVKYFVLKELLLENCVVWTPNRHDNVDGEKASIKAGSEVEARIILDFVAVLSHELSLEFTGQNHNPFFHCQQKTMIDITNDDNDTVNEDDAANEDNDAAGEDGVNDAGFGFDCKSDDQSLVSTNPATTPESYDSSDEGGIIAEMERNVIDDDDIDGDGMSIKKRKKGKKRKKNKATKTGKSQNTTLMDKVKQNKHLGTQNDIIMKQENKASNRDPPPPFGCEQRTSNVVPFGGAHNGGHQNINKHSGGQPNAFSLAARGIHSIQVASHRTKSHTITVSGLPGARILHHGRNDIINARSFQSNQGCDDGLNHGGAGAPGTTGAAMRSNRRPNTPATGGGLPNAFSLAGSGVHSASHRNIAHTTTASGLSGAQTLNDGRNDIINASELNHSGAGARGTMRAPMGSNGRPNRPPPGAMGPNGNARIELRPNNSRMNIRNNNGAALNRGGAGAIGSINNNVKTFQNNQSGDDGLNHGGAGAPSAVGAAMGPNGNDSRVYGGGRSNNGLWSGIGDRNQAAIGSISPSNDVYVRVRKERLKKLIGSINLAKEVAFNAVTMIELLESEVDGILQEIDHFQ